MGFRLILAKLQELGLMPSNNLQFLTPCSIRIFSQNCSMSLTNDFLRSHQIRIISKILYPYARDNAVTELASISNKIICRYKIAFSFNQQSFAIMAICIIPFMIWHIAHIYIVDSFLHGQFTKTGQSGYRSRWQPV